MIRLFIGIILGAAIVVLAAQNTGSVTYTFLAWQVTAPGLLVLLAVYVAGMFTSWLMMGISRITRRGRKR